MKMINSKLKITVISDLHCKHSSSDKDEKNKSSNSTFLYTDLLRRDSTPRHPIQSLIDNINLKKEYFKSKFLLCPGDITDKVDIQGFISGWGFLEEIKFALGADTILATLGNHDVDSRRAHPSLQPFTIAKTIKENYPIEDIKLRERFWNENFCIIEKEECIFLIYNSSHSHISYDDANKSKIDAETINKMNAEIRKLNNDKIKIALCHHHPIGQPNQSNEDNDIIDRGTELLDMLNNNNFSILIHGHKHEIKIRYYNSMVVFCSGSFSSRQNLIETESENAFHIIDFESDKKGLIHTWYYGTHNGWHQKLSLKFPPITGFGYRGNLIDLAEKINSWFTKESNGNNDLYINLIQAIPDCKFLIPEDHKKLKQILLDSYLIDFTHTENGYIKNISKQVQ